MRLPALGLLLALFFAISGCATPPSPSYDAFTRNKLAVLARSAGLARDGQQAAVASVADGLDRLRVEAGEGADPILAYQASRRVLAVAESRVRASRKRILRMDATGYDLFDEWSRELGHYDDAALRSEASRRRSEVKAAFALARSALTAAQSAADPLLTHLRDESLYLKHHRSASVVPPRPAKAVDPAPALARLQDLAMEAAARTEAFIAFVAPATLAPDRPNPTPPGAAPASTALPADDGFSSVLPPR